MNVSSRSTAIKFIANRPVIFKQIGRPNSWINLSKAAPKLFSTFKILGCLTDAKERWRDKMMEKKRKLQISVIGSSEPAPQYLVLAHQIGGVIASKGAILICGGLGGVMEAAARGAKEKGGLTVGIIPDYNKESANSFIDIVVPSGLGHARNILVAASGDLIVALPGSHGTRAEISIALKLGKPVIGLKAWGMISGVRQVNSIDEFEMSFMPNF